MASKNEIHAEISAELARQIRQLSERRLQIVAERAAICAAAVKSGTHQSPVVDEDERAAREHAKQLLNGSAPASLSLPPDVSRDRQLYREQRGLDIVLKILSDKKLVARAAAAVAWAEEHREDWCTLCREITLTAIRFEALERRAREFLAQCPDIFAVNLPMSVIGGGVIAEIPVSELTEAALGAGVVTDAEIRKAQKC